MSIKTQATDASITDYLNAVENQTRRQDATVLLSIFKEITGLPPKMWGTNKIGFGSYHYKYKSGQEGDWFLTGFSVGKTKLSLHIMFGLKNMQQLLDKLGKHKTSVGCLYINKLADVNMDILKKIIKEGFEEMQKMHP